MFYCLFPLFNFDHPHLQTTNKQKTEECQTEIDKQQKKNAIFWPSGLYFWRVICLANRQTNILDILATTKKKHDHKRNQKWNVENVQHWEKNIDWITFRSKIHHHHHQSSKNRSIDYINQMLNNIDYLNNNNNENWQSY